MDLAYDHIAEESLPKDEEGQSSKAAAETDSSINADFQAAYSAFSSSPWGARLGGFFGSVVKQVSIDTIEFHDICYSPSDTAVSGRVCL